MTAGGTASQPRPVVVMTPDWRAGGNPYLDLLAASVAAQGWAVRFADLPDGDFALTRLVRRERPDVLHLHWANELLAPCAWARHAVVGWLRRRKLAADVRAARRQGARVVWTVHNLVAHDSSHPQHELRARAVLADAVDHVIVHSNGALQALHHAYRNGAPRAGRCSVIHHGNYDGHYPPNPALEAQLRKRWRLDGDQTVLLFFGSVRRYKGLGRLLAAMRGCDRADLRVIVAGRPADDETRRELDQACANDPRLLVEPSFIADADAAAYYAVADAVVIPFERTLTSGSAVLAMTMGKALLLPGAARLLDLCDDSGALYFDDDAGLLRLLQTLDRVSVRTMGQRNRLAAAGFDWPTVGRRTALAYQPAMPQVAPR